MRKFSIHRNACYITVMSMSYFIHHVPEQWFPLISTNNNAQPRDDSTKRMRKSVLKVREKLISIDTHLNVDHTVVVKQNQGGQTQD